MSSGNVARLAPLHPPRTPSSPAPPHDQRVPQSGREEPKNYRLPGATELDRTEPEVRSVLNSSANGARTGTDVVSPGKKRRASIHEVIGLVPGSQAWEVKGSDGGKRAAGAARIKYALDLQQLTKLAEEYRFRLTKKQLKQEFNKLVKFSNRDDGKIDGTLAEDWIRHQSQQHRREARKVARSLFMAADDDNSGYLVREEVADLTEQLKAMYPEYKFDPPLDLDVDFAQMDKDGAGHVSWDEFDRWWARRSGDTEPTCPVLPEGMVSKLDHILELQGQEGGEGWDFLRPRLNGLVTLQRWWGRIGDLYSGSDQSLFVKEVLPKWIRHPESRTTQIWDVLSLVLIIWVAGVVPFRLGFDVDIDQDSVGFALDTVVDTFFIVDIIFQFRTAYPLPTGFLEVRADQIAKKYLKTWFAVDLVASLPLTYITLVYSSTSTTEPDGPTDSFSFAKTLRMIRLAKMLRVARLKRIVGRHASLVEFSAYMNSLITFFIILYISHLLACTWFWLGNTVSEDVRLEADGWAAGAESAFNFTAASTGEKYATSIYTIFKLGDVMAQRPSEQLFAFSSEIVISLIYGALAGVMSTLMMAGSIGEQEYLVKLAQLKAWMKAKHFTQAERMRLMSLFSANHQSSAFFNEKQVLSYLPLSVSRDLSLHLYAAIMNENPLFSNLGNEVMLSLCQSLIPQGFVAGNTVYEEGKIGDEMFFVVKGEFEVLKGRHAQQERLGYIGQGGFFGEICIIEAIGSKGMGAGRRIRTMRATTDSELAMLKSRDVLDLCDEFPELEMRLQSFRKAGLKLSAKGEQAKQARKYKEDMAAAQAPQESALSNESGTAVVATDGSENWSEAAMSRLLAAHTSKVMEAVQDIHTKLNEQQAALKEQQVAQAEIDRKLDSMTNS